MKGNDFLPAFDECSAIVATPFQRKTISRRSKRLGEQQHDAHAAAGGQEPGLQPPNEEQDQQRLGPLLHSLLVRELLNPTVKKQSLQSILYSFALLIFYVIAPLELFR